MNDISDNKQLHINIEENKKDELSNFEDSFSVEHFNIKTLDAPEVKTEFIKSEFIFGDGSFTPCGENINNINNNNNNNEDDIMDPMSSREMHTNYVKSSLAIRRHALLDNISVLEIPETHNININKIAINEKKEEDDEDETQFQEQQKEKPDEANIDNYVKEISELHNTSTMANLQSYVFPVECNIDFPKLEIVPSTNYEMNKSETRNLLHRVKHKVRRAAIVGESVHRNNAFRPRLSEKSVEERIALTKMLHQQFIFKHLQEHRLQLIVDAFEKRVFTPGEIVTLKDGAPSYEFHWIQHGSVIISNNNNNNNNNIINPITSENPSGFLLFNDNDNDDKSCQDQIICQTNENFGLERLLYMYNPRVDEDIQCRIASYSSNNNITSSSKSECKYTDDKAILWTINRVILKRILMMDALRERRRLLSLIDGVGIFQTLSTSDKISLTELLIPVSYTPGSLILQKGVTPNVIMLIDTGTVEATCDIKQNEINNNIHNINIETHARFLGRKSCIGAFEVFNNSPAIFNYIAYSHTSIYQLHASHIIQRLSSLVLQELTFTAGIHEGIQQEILYTNIHQEYKQDRDAASDSASEKDFTDDMCPVELKLMKDNSFLHQFLSTGAYKSASSMQRGLAVAAFTTLQEFPQGYIFFSEDPIIMNTMRSQQCLYVIVSGIITLLQENEIIATYKQGQSIGEEILLHKRRAIPATTAIVSSETCKVYCLDRKSFRCLLMPAFLKHLRLTRALLLTTPIASYLNASAILALSRSSSICMVKPGEVLLTQGSEIKYVELIIEGTIDVTQQEEEEDNQVQEVKHISNNSINNNNNNNGNELTMKVVASLGSMDIIGALDLLHQCTSLACYIARSYLRTFRIPVELFMESCLNSPSVVKYLNELQRTRRYNFFNSQIPLLIQEKVEKEGAEEIELSPRQYAVEVGGSC